MQFNLQFHQMLRVWICRQGSNLRTHIHRSRTHCVIVIPFENVINMYANQTIYSFGSSLAKWISALDAVAILFGAKNWHTKCNSMRCIHLSVGRFENDSFVSSTNESIISRTFAARFFPFSKSHKLHIFYMERVFHVCAVAMQLYEYI